MRSTIHLLLLAAGAIAVLAGCLSPVPQDKAVEPVSPLTVPEEISSGEDRSPLPQPTSTPAPDEGSAVVPAQAAGAVTWAQADLAQRLGIATGQIAVVSVEAVQWRDSSLGCPQPGRMYAQVITPGYRIVLRVVDELYEYHSAEGSDNAVYCQPGTSTSAESLAAEGIVLVYERSGGLAGVSERWVIYGDGRVVTGDGRESRVTPKEVAEVASEARELGFFDMADKYMPKDPCCDRFTYTITIQGRDGMHTVETMDGTESAPQALWDLLDMIAQLIEQAFPLTSQDALGVAIADLAARLDLDRASIQMIEVSRQEFPLPDLGCPSPKDKESVLPAVVFGQLIRLRAADVEYEYHARGQDVRFCGEQPR